MNVEYCIKCGGKAEFSVSKPKFCPSCGSAFNRFERQDQKQTKRPNFEEIYDEEDDDDDDEYQDEFSNLNIERLKRRVVVKAEVESNARRTIGDLAPPSSSDLTFGSREPRQGEEGLDSADIVRKIQQECRQIKSSND